MAFDDIYRPFLDSGRRLVRDSLSGARANPGAMVGVPNAQRDDPYPRFDPTAATRRDIGATAWGSVYGEEPRTPEELEVASGVDRRIPDAPRSWSEPTRIPGLGSYATTPDGGYALSHGDAGTARRIAPSPLFSGVAGEDFEATRRRGEQVARLMREQDGPFANPNDWNYIRSYGPRAAAQAVASGRANISGADPDLVAQERERFLRNRTTDLSISPQLRAAARDELAQIEREAAEERRREMWAAEQAARLRMAEGANAATVEAARVTADGQIRAAQAKAAADAAAAEAAGKGKPVQLDPESPGLYVDGTFWKNPAYNPKPVTAGGNGIGRWNPDTGSWDFEWPDKGGAKKAPVTLKPGESYYDPETKETYVAPGADRMSIESEIANLTAALGKADGTKQIAAIERQLADARARLAALGAAAPAPGGASSPSEPPAPAAQPAAPAPAPAPAPAQPAPAPAPAAAQEQKPAPKGYRRLPNGELEYVG